MTGRGVASGVRTRARGVFIAGSCAAAMACAPGCAGVFRTADTPVDEKERDKQGPFPVTVQFSPVPDAPGWQGGDQKLDEALVSSTFDNIIAHGCTALYLPQAAHLGAPVPEALHPAIAGAARARGMKVTWQTHGLELFNRMQPPQICVYSPRYAEAVRKNVAEKLAPLAGRPDAERVFCYQDEPFHQGAESFGTNDEVRAEFRRRYGYDLPLSHESVRDDPVKWLDVINFRSDYFPDGWRQTYQAVKATHANFKVIMTHDSHGTFGGAAGSDARLFVDDVYHWGGDFADTFVYDSYPYMMTDFRYGECSRIAKPRMSQFHYSFAQMRNVTRAYGKELGFWFGTYNALWFKDFMGEELRRMTWLERETATTAVAQGADFLIFGLGIPQDAGHWRELGKGLNLIQRCGPGLLRAPKVKAKAAFLFPRTQCVQLQEEYWNVGLSFELFLRAFGELDVLHEEQVTDDALGGYQMLCLFDVQLLPEDVAGRIAAFVRKGGVVVADCVPQLGRHKAPLQTLLPLFGVDAAATGRVKRSGLWLEHRALKPGYARPLAPEEVSTAAVRGSGLGGSYDFTVASPRPCRVTDGEVLLKTQDGQPALIRRKSGRGSAWLLGFCAQDSYFQAWKADDGNTRGQLYGLLSAIAEKSGVRPHVHSSNPDVEASVRASAREAYLFVIDHEAPVKTARIRLAELPFKIRRVTDIESGKDVPFERQGRACVIDADVSGGVTKIMRLTPAP